MGRHWYTRLRAQSLYVPDLFDHGLITIDQVDIFGEFVEWMCFMHGFYAHNFNIWPRFELERLTLHECRLWFRFEKADLPLLAEDLRLPEWIRTPGRFRFHASDGSALCDVMAAFLPEQV